MSEIKEEKAIKEPGFEPVVDGERPKRGVKAKRRPCSFCMAKVAFIDYKDVGRLRKYLTEKGKIIARRQTGLCAHHQRELTTAIKRARNMSLI
jgi:small subunit ribosomal protein S18